MINKEQQEKKNEIKRNIKEGLNVQKIMINKEQKKTKKERNEKKNKEDPNMKNSDK